MTDKVKTPKLKEYVKVIRPAPTPFNIWVIITNDLTKSIHNAYLKFEPDGQFGPEEDDQFTGAMCVHKKGHGDIYVVIPLNCNISNIAHESYHAVKAACRFCYIDDEEYIAYLLGYLVNEISEFVKKHEVDDNESRKS